MIPAEMGPAVLAAAVQGGTAILLAALGELVAERAGVLNLGLEGIMLCGALAGFAGSQATGSALAGVGIAVAVGAGFGLLHAAFTVALGGSQVVCGLAVLILGTGASGYLGKSLIGRTAPGLAPLELPLLSGIPGIGPALFRQDPLVYLAWLMVPLLTILLERTRCGLALTAVGEAPIAADAQGVRVLRVRALATLFGGAMAGLAGAHLSLAYSRMWIERMTAGRGWIALAVVIFSFWHPLRAFFGAYLFGAVTALQFRLQTSQAVVERMDRLGISVPILQMLPYLATVLVLVLTLAWRRTRGVTTGAPAALTLPFRREDRD